ncbi:hypothetical protein BDM02DRAFT_3114952 [Thelephora ganbajun]|uniref:Uncharacterized protein n=1 Tax=Thelephora ganbajun TaxID=370292 RepID=A0ACB6ZG28_THEGA|nr:hypothetical protein BDM02DRAFT_3114952 [Thelephora ganbajun]
MLILPRLYMLWVLLVLWGLALQRLEERSPKNKRKAVAENLPGKKKAQYTNMHFPPCLITREDRDGKQDRLATERVC